jgi:hypothetical protein
MVRDKNSMLLTDQSMATASTFTILHICAGRHTMYGSAPTNTMLHNPMSYEAVYIRPFRREGCNIRRGTTRLAIPQRLIFTLLHRHACTRAARWCDGACIFIGVACPGHLPRPSVDHYAAHCCYATASCAASAAALGLLEARPPLSPERAASTSSVPYASYPVSTVPVHVLDYR